MCSNRIKQLRDENRMTQIKLSTELEVSQETVSGYESGRHNPSVAVLLKLVDLFHVSSDYILGISDNRNGFYRDIDSKERVLLEKYNKLSIKGKERLSGYINCLLEDEE